AQPGLHKRFHPAVPRAVAAGDPLAADAVAGDDPLPLEQELGEGAAILVAREEARGERPPALRGRCAGGAGAREPPRPSLGPRDPVTAAGPERLPGVVRHLACPDEV